MKKIFLLIICLCIFCSCSTSEAIISNNICNEGPVDDNTLKTEKTDNEIEKFSDKYDIEAELDNCPSSINDENYNSFYNETEWMVSSNTTWPNTEFPDTVESDSTIIIKGEFSSGFPVVDNSVPLERIIYPCDGQTIMGDLFFSEYQYKTYVNTYDGIIQDSKNMLAYPIVTLRKIGDGKYYDVRKYRYGGYLYTFYDRVYDANTGQYESEDETLITEIGGVYMEEILSYSDFSSLKTGDHINEVEKIDSAIGIYKIYSKLDEASAGAYGDNDLRMDYQMNKTTSLHLLTDGLLTIHYEKINNEYYISDMVFSKDFIYEPPYIEDCYGNSYQKLFKILPQDFPPEK